VEKQPSPQKQKQEKIKQENQDVKLNQIYCV
jgi:hypothetical protein